MRKIVQIAAFPIAEKYREDDSAAVVALCNDGSLWWANAFAAEWKRMPPIPQDEEPAS